MSQTTTAAIWSGRPKPSFDSVLASLPEELSPANRGREDENSFLSGDPHVMMMTTAAAPRDHQVLTHSDVDLCDASHDLSRARDVKAVDLAGLCRNTFVHLESASPLARVSHEFLQSLREYSGSNGGGTGGGGVDGGGVDGEEEESSNFQQSPETKNSLTIPNEEAIRDLKVPLDRYSEIHYQERELSSSRGRDPSTPTPTSSFARDIHKSFGDEWVFDGPLGGTPMPKRAFFLDAWVRGEGAQHVRVSNLCTWINEKKLNGLTNIFASAVAHSLNLEENGRSRTAGDNSTQNTKSSIEEAHGTDSNSKNFREGHPHNCKPCAFYWSKGCLNGNECAFCHQWHVPKRKKPMREQKNLMIISKEDGKIAFLRCHVQDALTGGAGTVCRED